MNAVSLSILVAVAAAGVSRPPDMPPILLYYKSTEPVWVIAAEAVDASGRVRAEMFRDPVGVQKILDEPDNGCLHFPPAYRVPIRPEFRDTIDHAIRHSQIVVLGRVTNKAYGFLGGWTPGQLIQIEVEQSYGARLPPKPYYFFVPIGEFLLGQRLICQEDESYAHPPEIGSEVFLFLDGPPLHGQQQDLLFIDGPGDIVPVERDGSLSLPQQYFRDPGEGARVPQLFKSKADLLDRIDRIRRGDPVQ